MRRFIVILLLFAANSTFAQNADLKALDKAISDFDHALTAKDSAAIKKGTHHQLLYGHSNGWVETKRELIDDLYNGKISYKRITSGKREIVADGNTAAVRMDTEVEVEMEGKLLSFRLIVLQVWVWKKAHWELFARQAVKNIK